MSNKFKSEFMLEKGGLAGWLRTLAEAVEAGELPAETGPVSLSGYRSLKLSFEEDLDGKVLARLSVKYPKPPEAVPGAQPGAEPEEAPGKAEEGLPKYKSLKKHMKHTFKAIGLALGAGRIPPALEAGSFLADAKLMVGYADKGEEFYGPFREKVEAFEAALAASDLEAMKALYRDLAQIKRDCHSRHA